MIRRSRGGHVVIGGPSKIAQSNTQPETETTGSPALKKGSTAKTSPIAGEIRTMPVGHVQPARLFAAISGEVTTKAQGGLAAITEEQKQTTQRRL
jgi:hypothetical protein